MTRVLAVDLDDTLFRTDKTVSDQTVDSLRKWQAAGNKLVIATGRPPRTVARDLPTEFHQLPWIVYNGAEIYHDSQRVYHDLIPTDDTRTIIELLMSHVPDITLGLEIDNVLYLNRQIERPAPFEVTDLFSVAVEPVAKILFYSDDFDSLRGSLSRLPQSARALLSMKYRLVQILSSSADKGEALRHLVQMWGLTMADVIAVGDDVNDVGMVDASGLGVAVENAVDEVKAVANKITLSNDNDGVACLISDLLAI